MIIKLKYILGAAAFSGIVSTAFVLTGGSWDFSKIQVFAKQPFSEKKAEVYLDSRGVQVRAAEDVKPDQAAPAEAQPEATVPEVIRTEKTPEKEVHALYLTAQSASSQKKLDDTVALLKRGGLNALVIDLKDFSGSVYFDSTVPAAKDLNTIRNKYKDLAKTISDLHSQGIYVIARITVFQDPLLAEKKPEWAIKDNVSGGLWHDFKGLSWVDPTLPEVWQYNIDLAKDAVRFGFDEINFDYIRFPSDGNIKRMKFKNWDGSVAKHVKIAEFFSTLYNNLKDEPVYLSGDLFGLTTIRKDDMNIGQLIDDAGKYFDYLCPMMYPSHYPKGFMKFANPADHPYEIIKSGLVTANERLKALEGNRAKLRPWIQDFDIGAVYGRDKIQLEEKAVIDGGGFGYLSWNARNVYNAAEYK